MGFSHVQGHALESGQLGLLPEQEGRVPTTYVNLSVSLRFKG